MKNKLICFVSIMMFLLCMMGAAAAQTDDAGNVFISESDAGVQTVERDLYWAGSSRSFSGYRIGKSFVAAGRDITVSETEVGGSLRAAGYTVTLNGVDVEDNITAAGYDLQMSGITAAAVYAAGNKVCFSGTAESVGLAGDTVTLEGEIHGNAYLYGDNIILGESLKVDGTLTVEADSEPAVPSGAKIGQFVFRENETADDAEDAAEGITITKTRSGFETFLRGMFGALLLGALMCLLIGAEDLEKPGAMLLSRPFPMLGSGFAGLFVIPGVILILLFTGFGFSGSGLLAMLFALSCFYSLTYAGVTLVKALMPKLTDQKLLNNEWICSLIGALVFWLVRKVPWLGTVLQFASLIYTLGYFIQVIFLRLRSSGPQKAKGTLAEPPQNDVLEPVSGLVPPAPAVPSPDVLEKFPSPEPPAPAPFPGQPSKAPSPEEPAEAPSPEA